MESMVISRTGISRWRSRFVAAALGMWVAAGCGGGGGSDAPNTPEPPPPTGDSCSGGQTLLYVVSSIGVATPVSATVVPGFDVDARVSGASDSATCNQPDFTSPPPASTPGIDNQLGPLVAAFDFADDVSIIFDASIEDASLLVLVRVENVQSTSDDDCVNVSFLKGIFPPSAFDPVIGPDGQLAPGQLFDIDSTFLASDGATPLYRVEGATITDGVLDTGLTRLTPIYDLNGTSLPITFNRLQVRLDGDRGRDGLIGGSFGVEEVAAVIGPGLGALEPFVIPALHSKADLAQDGSGVCQELSAGLTFSAVSAVAGEVR